MENALVLPSEAQTAAFLAERAAVNDAAYLQPDDSALCALTDFRHEHPITVHADSFVGDALRDMNLRSVHALLVTREVEFGIGEQVVGMITYFDIERRHSHRHPHGTLSMQFSRLRVAEVMAPCEELSLVNYQSLQSLSASDLYEMFQGTGLTHLLVVERHGNGSTLARGLLSRASLTMRLHRARTMR
ncbi:MAG: CBS domain-containing protein [Steroidobacteraceae bacterium]